MLHCIDTQNFVLYLFTNQRTNGPVNAHLISRPTIGTKTSFAKFDSRKIGLGQLRVLIYINFVKLEYTMLHAKFHDHRTISSFRKRFLKVFTIYGGGGCLGHVTWTIYINFLSPFPRSLLMIFDFYWPSSFREDL